MWFLLYVLAGAWAQTVLSRRIAPKVMVVAMFEPEQHAWTSRVPFEHEVQVPGLSLSYPGVRCTKNWDVCQFTTGEGEINAATSMAFVLALAQFDFSQTFWLLSGIAGGEPSQITTGLVAFSRFAVQVGLAYQIDPKEIPEKNWTTGYFAYGTTDPWTYPEAVYGTEVYELNDNLRQRALRIASQANLDVGDDQNIALRQLYDGPARQAPRVVGCDVLTLDNYFTGELLSGYFGDYTKLVTNGTATYCSTAQEENATLEALLRMAKHGVVDFSRIIIMRAISNFVRAPASLDHDPIAFFANYPKGSFNHALANLYNAGWPVVQDILANWSDYENLTPDNYVGDILGSLGGKPDFGRDSYLVH